MDNFGDDWGNDPYAQAMGAEGESVGVQNGEGESVANVSGESIAVENFTPDMLQEVINENATFNVETNPEAAQESNTIYPQGEFTREMAAEAKKGIAAEFMTLAQSATSGDADVMLQAIEKFSKSQLVRVLDVVILGPTLIWWAYRGKLSAGERLILGLIGAGTVSYNLRNYMKNKQILQPEYIQSIKQQLSQSMSGR